MADSQAIKVTSSPLPHAAARRIPMFVVCAVVFLLALSIRLGLMYTTQSYRLRIDCEVERVANSLAQGRGYANAFGNTGPTAHMSPLYPLLLSVVYRWVRDANGRQVGQEVLSCFLSALTWGLVPLVGEICRLDRRVGIGAALGGVLCINRWPETKGWFESALAGLACLLLVMLFMKCWYARDFSARAGVLAGIVSGLAMLVSGSLGSIVFALLVTGLIFFRDSGGRQCLRFTLVTIAVVGAVLLPWALRNYFVLGGLVWTRSNLPLELRVSNNDEAETSFWDNAVARQKYHPFENAEQRTAVRTMGELAYQQKVKGEALGWIRSHPRRFAWLTVQRIYYFWFPKMPRLVQRIALDFLTGTSIPALIVLLRRKPPLAYGLLAILLTYPLVYYVVQADQRYVYPIQWILYLLASQCIVLVFEYWTAGAGRRWRHEYKPIAP